MVRWHFQLYHHHLIAKNRDMLLTPCFYAKGHFASPVPSTGILLKASELFAYPATVCILDRHTFETQGQFLLETYFVR